MTSVCYNLCIEEKRSRSPFKRRSKSSERGSEPQSPTTPQPEDVVEGKKKCSTNTAYLLLQLQALKALLLLLISIMNICIQSACSANWHHVLHSFYLLSLTSFALSSSDLFCDYINCHCLFEDLVFSA